VEQFEQHYRRLYRYLDRLTGDPEQAADLAQETFVRLYQRGSMPDDTAAW
jgi:DNA-directed RNA polymerase specialized sigma24 family protein